VSGKDGQTPISGGTRDGPDFILLTDGPLMSQPRSWSSDSDGATNDELSSVTQINAGTSH